MIISLIDTIAFDVQKKLYCRHPKLLEFQMHHTYMKQYKEIIKVANTEPEEEYHAQYLRHNPPLKSIDPTEKRIEDKVFEDKDFCQNWCKQAYNPLYLNPKGEHYVLKCNEKLK